MRKTLLGGRKFIGIAALVALIVLGQQLGSAQQQKQIGRADLEKLAKAMLEHMAKGYYPVLEGASIKYLGEGSYAIHLSAGKDFTVQAGSNSDVGSFMSAVERGLTETLPKQKAVTEEMAREWFAQLAVSEPDLRGIILFLEKEMKGRGGQYVLKIGSLAVDRFELPGYRDNQEEFVGEVRAFLRGDTYKKRTPEGVTTEIRSGALRVMWITGVVFGYENVYFMHQAGSPCIRMAGEKLNNQKFVWEKTGERDLLMTVTHKDGASARYAIKDGVLLDPSKNLILYPR